MADPKIKYDIEAAVKGEADINAMAQRLEDMGKILDTDLSPAAKEAATEMRALGAQQSAIVAFAKLSEQVKASENDLSKARMSAKSFSAEIASSGPPTAEQTAMLAKLNAQVDASTLKLDGQKQAMQAAGKELTAYGLTGDRIIEAQRQTSASFVSLKNSIEATIPGMRSVGSAGEESAVKINSAWNTLGVRSFTQTQTEIAKVKTALDTIKSSGASPLEIKMATESAQAKIKELEGGINNVGSAASGVTGLLRQLGPLMVGAFGAQQFIEIITASESLNRSFEQIFGSAGKARQEMDFVRQTSNKLGIDTLTLAKSYQSLAASTKGTVLEGQATRDVFEAVSRAMSTLGKSSEETDRALLAISQMASKGTASMEELRGQLGEALPGAMKAAADGAGITVEQLVEMVSSGSVLAKDILPALTVGLNGLYGKAAPPQTVISEWARFKNVMTETSTVIGESGVSSGIAKGLSLLGKTAQYAVADADLLIAALNDLGSSMGTGSINSDRFNLKLEEYRKKLGATESATNQAATAQATLTGAQNATNESAQAAARNQELLAQKTDATGESALKVKQRYGELIKGSKEYTDQVTSQVDAVGKEQAVLTSLVALYGTEKEKREVASAAANAQAAAAEKLAAAENAQVVVANSYVIKLREQALANNDNTEATKKQIEEAQKNAQTLQTEFEKTNAVAQSKRIEAEASKAQEQALKDNSSRVWEYQGAMSAAKAEVERLTKAHDAGKATDQQVIEAKTKLATATLLYRDAVKDLSDAYHQLGIKTPDELNKIADTNAKAWDKVKTDSSLSASAVKTAFENYAKSVIEAAGSVDSAQYQVTAETLRTEAAAKGLSVAFDEAGRVIVKSMDSGKNAANGLTDSVNTATSALQRQNDVLENTLRQRRRELDLLQEQVDLENRRRGVDREGFATDKNGQRIVAGGDLTTLTGIAAFLKSAGVADEAKARQIAREFADSQGNITYMNNPGQRKYGGDTISMALLKAAETYTFGIGNTGTEQKPSTIPEPSKTYTVNLNINGTNTPINVASPTDAQNFIEALNRAKLSA